MSRFMRIYIIVVFFLSLAICSGASYSVAADKIPDIFVSSSVKSKLYFILVEKKTQKFFLYSYDGSSYEQILNIQCSTGKADGAKRIQGDQKTPEGIYFFDNYYHAKHLADIYGNGAFSMDFPNSLDNQKGIKGSSIWLHGTNKDLKPKDSNGCVTIDNDNFDKLVRYITLKKTPIIVVEHIEDITQNSYKKNERAILSLIYKTKEAVQTGTYHDYLSYYDPDFLPNITWWNSWITYRKNLKKDKILYSIEQDNIFILKYKTFYLAVFDQYIKLKENNTKIYIGREKKFIGFDKNEKPKIISEESLELPKDLYLSKGSTALISVASELVGRPDQETEIAKLKDMINFWLKAWSEKNINSYAKCYSKNFFASNKNLEEWLDHKKTLNSKYKFIKVTAENLKIKFENNKYRVTFVQNYVSDRYKARGIKNLILVRENKEWKIYREGWKKL